MEIDFAKIVLGVTKAGDLEGGSNSHEIRKGRNNIDE